MSELRKIKIGADGEQLPADAPEWVAVLLPDHNLIFTRRSVVDESCNQPACLDAAHALTLAGHSDWDLPTPAELSLLIDRDRYDPAIDTAFFDVKNDWYWTKQIAAWSDPAAGLSAVAWNVHFLTGLIDANRRYYHGFALAVRRPGQ